MHVTVSAWIPFATCVNGLLGARPEYFATHGLCSYVDLYLFHHHKYWGIWHLDLTFVLREVLPSASFLVFAYYPNMKSWLVVLRLYPRAAILPISRSPISSVEASNIASTLTNSNSKHTQSRRWEWSTILEASARLKKKLSKVRGRQCVSTTLCGSFDVPEPAQLEHREREDCR